LRPLLPLAAVLLLSACEAQAPQRPKDDMKELMAHVVDPAAFMIWNSSGEVTDAEGTRDRYPTDDAGWKVIEDGAVMVAESANLLKLAGRPRDPEDRWNGFADDMAKRALEVKAAAEARNKQAIFDTGGRLYETCQACHQKFIIEAQQQAERK
jgi:hypothetical protein